jgi:hypothetical protein
LARSTIDGSQNDLGTDTEVVLVEAVRASTAVDLSFEDGVEGTDGTSSHEGEIAIGTRKSANTASIDRIAGLADTISV